MILWVVFWTPKCQEMQKMTGNDITQSLGDVDITLNSTQRSLHPKVKKCEKNS